MLYLSYLHTKVMICSMHLILFTVLTKCTDHVIHGEAGALALAQHALQHGHLGVCESRGHSRRRTAGQVLGGQYIRPHLSLEVT